MAAAQRFFHVSLLVAGLAAGPRSASALSKDLWGSAARARARRLSGAGGVTPQATQPPFASVLQGCDGFDCVLRYIAHPDPSYAWRDTGARIHGRDAGTGVGWTGYVLNMTSQRWLTLAVVDFPLWWHIMVVVVPENWDETVDWATVTLDFGGNSGSDDKFRVDNRVLPGHAETMGGFMGAFLLTEIQPAVSITAENLQMHLADLEGAADKAAYIATRTRAIGTSVLNLPNAYETFKDDPLLMHRSSDWLKGYTYGNFLEHPDEPERIMDLPVAKAAVRALDTITAFCAQQLGFNVTRFGVAGYSKLATATWVTGAADARVKAIVPVAINLDLYDNLGITEPKPSEQTTEVVRVVDPRDPYAEEGMNGYTAQLNKMHRIIDPSSFFDRLTMPKLFVMAAGDSVIPALASGHPERHLRAMKGATTFLEIPDCQHGASLTRALPSAAAFFRGAILGKSAPQIAYAFDNATGTITARQVSDDAPIAVRLWTGPPPPTFLDALPGPFQLGTETWASVQLWETSPGSRSWTTGPPPADGRYWGRFVSFEYEWPERGTPFQASTPLWSTALHP